MLALSEHNLYQRLPFSISFPALMTRVLGQHTLTLLSRDMRAEWWAGGVLARDKSRAGGACGTPLW